MVFARYSAREIISCSGRYFMIFEINDLLTGIKPAFAALECQFR
jgi:hypothetical protein